MRRSFAEPIVAAETIARCIGKLVVQLCAALEERGLGARRLDLLCRRVDAHVQFRHWCLVAQHHWDEVSWAIAEHAWRFEPLLAEVT